MLQDKINECRVLISDVSENKQISQQNQSKAKKNNTFFEAYNNIFVPTIKSYAVCKKYGYNIFSESVMSDIQKCIEDTKNIFDKKVVMDPLKYQMNVSKLSENLSKEWINQSNEKISEIREELGILKLVSNKKMMIQNIIYSLNNFCGWPITENIMKKYNSAIANANEMLSQMKFDDEIQEFLKKVKDKEATLLDLTDPIIEWIRKEELSDNIMLSIKN